MPVTEKLKLLPYQQGLFFVLLPVCVIVAWLYGWSAFSILTRRPGLHGNMYLYVSMSRNAYLYYNLLVFAVSVCSIVCQLYFAFNLKLTALNYTFWGTILLLVVLIVFESYLQSRNLGKP